MGERPQSNRAGVDERSERRQLVPSESELAEPRQQLGRGPGVPQTQYAGDRISWHARARHEQFQRGAAGTSDSECAGTTNCTCHGSGTSAPATTEPGAGVPLFGVAGSGRVTGCSVSADSVSLRGPWTRSSADCRSNSTSSASRP